MKRKPNLYEQIISRENILSAILSSTKNKKQSIAKSIRQHPEIYVDKIEQIMNIGWVPSEYHDNIRVVNGKERKISTVPFFPDRIIHHMIMNIVSPILERSLIDDTYQSIPGRGVHKAIKKIKRDIALKKPEYALKIDIAKFYQSINNDILKEQLRRKIKCKHTLKLLDDLIDSYPGLPIGNYTSPIFGNFYLSELDHQIKERFRAKLYYRYADDILICGEKKFLQDIYKYVKIKVNELKLKLNKSTQLFKIGIRPINFIGYRIWHTHSLPRKQMIFKAKNNPSEEELASLFGWFIHVNSLILVTNLYFKYLEIIGHYSSKYVYKCLRSFYDIYGNKERTSSTASPIKWN